MTALRTARTRMRPITETDAEWLAAHWNDPVVREYLFDGEPVSGDLVAEIIDESDTDFATWGYGLWLIDVGGTPVGVCGLRATDDGQAELLYSVDPKCQGRGLATETARAVLDLAFEALGLRDVIAEADHGNDASRRVAQRLGMTELPEKERSHRFVKTGRGDCGA